MRSSSPARPDSTSTGTAGFARVARPSASRTRRSRSRPEASGSATSTSTRSGNFVSQQTQGVGSAVRDEDLVAVGGQVVGQEGACGVVVLDDQQGGGIVGHAPQ